MLRVKTLAALIALSLIDGCTPNGAETDGGLDGGPLEASSSDAWTEGGVPDAAPIDGGDAGAACGDFVDASCWAHFRIGSVVVDDAGPGTTNNQYWGAAFDGRYTYFVPNGPTSQQGHLVRYDTTGTFSSAGAWSFFNMRQLNTRAIGYAGAVFDGQYIYLPPYANGMTVPNSLTIRYDTTKPLVAASFELFDMTGIGSTAETYVGGAYDGRYVYYSPSTDVTAPGKAMVRFDTQGSFSTVGSWQTFDVTTVTGTARGFYGAVFDGRYVYYVPGGGVNTSTVVRYDTTGLFTAGASWSAFDIAAFGQQFSGAAFDGRYVYFAPFGSGLVRYDTQASFGAAGSYVTMDLSLVNPNADNFEGAVFDGRYIFLIPWGSKNGGAVVVRYDTQADFSTPASYSVADLGTLDPSNSIVGSRGGAFDGEHIYFVPGTLVGDAFQFDARAKAALPSSYHGSFY